MKVAHFAEKALNHITDVWDAKSILKKLFLDIS